MISHANTSSRSRRGRAAALLVALVLAVPAALQATAHDGSPDPDDPVKPAAELRAEAMAIVEQTGDLDEAADFLVETATALDLRDPERARNLQVAARYYHHAGNLDEAYRAMVDAAEAAYLTGAYAMAADALLDAGIVAAQDGKQGVAWRTAHKAGYVLRTQDFSPEERLRILGRVVYLPSPVAEEPNLASDSEKEKDEG